MAPRVLVANGVNLDLLGRREPHIYGQKGLDGLEAAVRSSAPTLAKAAGLAGCNLTFFQSNDEAAFLSQLDQNWDGILINPGAWTHTSLALADRLRALETPFVEVHLSNVAAREPFRHRSYSAPYARGVVHGLGLNSYLAGLFGLLLDIALPEECR